MTRISRSIVALFVFTIHASAEVKLLQMTVTSTTRDSVFVDLGHDDGVRIGQKASFFLADVGEVAAIVRGSLPDTARVEILQDVSVPIGTQGRIAVTTVTPIREPQASKRPTLAPVPSQEAAPIETLDNAAAATATQHGATARKPVKTKLIIQPVASSHSPPSANKDLRVVNNSTLAPIRTQKMARIESVDNAPAATGKQSATAAPAIVPTETKTALPAEASSNEPQSSKKEPQTATEPTPAPISLQKTAQSPPVKKRDASSQDTLLQVTVTSTTGRSIFIDLGRNDGIEPGHVARFFPPGLGEVEGVVRDASPDTARIEVIDATAIPVGTHGEIAVPAGSRVNQKDTTNSRVPSHAPWTRKMESQDESVPLLSPVQRQKASDRPPEIDGRVYTQFDYTWDRGDDRLAEYYYARMGVTMSATNQLGWGERFELSTQGSVRGYKQEGDEEEGGGSERDTRWRLDRLSFTLGGYEYSPYRLQLGRFYPTDVPEIGLIDGVEAAVLYPNGLRIGGTLGFLPLPSAERKTGDDFSANLFLAKQPKRGESLSYMLVYEKTWHKGEADRDLILGRISLQPTESLWLYGSFKADIYTSGDPNKGSGIGLTQAYLQARYTPSDKYGFGLSLSHFEWPDILREEYGEPDPELIDEGHVDRAELSAWYKLTPDFRVTGRVNAWEDHRDQGYGGQIGFDWTNISRYDFSLHSSVRYTTGSFTEGTGYRLELRKNFKSIYTYLAYDRYDYETINADDVSSEYTRQTLRGGLDWRFGNWALNVSEHYEFGDNDDAFGTELYLEYRF